MAITLFSSTRLSYFSLYLYFKYSNFFPNTHKSTSLNIPFTWLTLSDNLFYPLPLFPTHQALFLIELKNSFLIIYFTFPNVYELNLHMILIPHGKNLLFMWLHFLLSNILCKIFTITSIRTFPLIAPLM